MCAHTVPIRISRRTHHTIFIAKQNKSFLYSHKKDILGTTRIRTRVGGFKVRNDNQLHHSAIISVTRVLYTHVHVTETHIVRSCMHATSRSGTVMGRLWVGGDGCME